MTKEQFLSISSWQKNTFGEATAISKLNHLEQEFLELKNAIQDEDHLIDNSKIRNTKTEFADCFILLFGSASSYGMSYEDICKAIDDKMNINYKRNWGKPDANGVVNHIK